MNDTIRAAVNARLHEQRLTRADLARKTGLRPQAITRALNGAEGGGTVPPAWALILEALGLQLTAVPVGDLPGGLPLPLSAADVPPAELEARVDEALKLLGSLKAGLRADAAGNSTNSATPAPAAGDGEAGRAAGEG